MALIRFRPVADSKYRTALDNLGVQHGSEYDCQRENCRTCQPHRDMERAYWLSLTDEEKAQVRFFKYALT